MRLIPGSRLRSQVCSTEVIVVRCGASPTELTCGGSPMVPVDGSAVLSGQPVAGLDGGNELGKRYSNGTIEVLVTKPGVGSIAAGGTVLEAQQARTLPSSD